MNMVSVLPVKKNGRYTPIWNATVIDVKREYLSYKTRFISIEGGKSL